jgi:hypothetical protein
MNSKERAGEAAHAMTDEIFGYAKHTIQLDKDSIQIEVELKTLNGTQTATVFSPDIELTKLAKTLILNWLRLRDGPNLPDGICVISNIPTRKRNCSDRRPISRLR